MTIIKVEKEIFTPNSEVNIQLECLTDDLVPITMGTVSCILNNNLLVDTKEVNEGKVNFNFNMPETLDSKREHVIRFIYNGSIQADRKIQSAIILYDVVYEHDIEANLISEDYFCNREDTIKIKAVLETEDDMIVNGNAVCKLDAKTIGSSEIVNNVAEVEFTVPGIMLNEHVLFWKFNTDYGIFMASSILHLTSNTPIISTEYYENKGVSDEIRKILKQKAEKSQDEISKQEDSDIFNKIKNIFN